MKRQEPCKRRGRPQKKQSEPSLPQEQLFSIHDNIFHASVLLFTTRVISKTPYSAKFNPTIGYSVYEKVKSLTPEERQYYCDDSKAIDSSLPFAHNRQIVNFFVNSLTFAPACVIDEFYLLFHFVLARSVQPSAQECLDFTSERQFKYLNFGSKVQEVLLVRTAQEKEQLRKVIARELGTLFEIVSHSLCALKEQRESNKFIDLIDAPEEAFERSSISKGRKKAKTDFS